MVIKQSLGDREGDTVIEKLQSAVFFRNKTEDFYNFEPTIYEQYPLRFARDYLTV